MRFLSVFLMFLLISNQAFATSRIKDIADIEGVRDNMLVGYGLVVGLNGTGDSLTKAIFTRESLIGMLERLGVNARDKSLKTKNVAAVVVTASLPPFARQGGKINIQVATIGDATSLQGGELMVTPLMGADGEVYAVGQGPLAVEGLGKKGASKAVATSARIAGGALVEKEVPFDFSDMKTLKLALRNPDFTTAKRMSDSINTAMGLDVARTLDAGTVQLQVPTIFQSNPVQFITKLEQLNVEPDQIAKVLIDDQTGLVVMGENVRINKVAIAQGNLSVNVTDASQIVRLNKEKELADAAAAEAAKNAPPPAPGAAPAAPAPAAKGPATTPGRIAVFDTGVSLHELVEGLNALGVAPRDLISILQGIKAAGALQAEVEVI